METSQATRGSIIALHDEGLSNREIARRYGISHHTVARWIRRHADTGTTIDKQRSGRPRCKTANQDRTIRAASMGNPFYSTTTIRAQHDIRCMPQTIRNRLHTCGLHGRKPAYKPDLTERNMEQRMEYALQYADKPPSFWDNTIFCDEKTFSTDADWVSWVWRSINTR